MESIFEEPGVGNSHAGSVGVGSPKVALLPGGRGGACGRIRNGTTFPPATYGDIVSSKYSDTATAALRLVAVVSV